ncbi:hypothetical protein [Novosphingobium cyanobacteriorum]|uniref:Uncharacterized protein n=1 Tax=Novosphingobium cyanobacteriorum TaxID=3024215 RepID=A0ABT6CJR6_9SPHN|nr:hypothetical protein [Novosphingobium cyanobacteriorum]MDF8333528.1 hypothetical protein [Novosphingobium cyanobacteriorum]
MARMTFIAAAALATGALALGAPALAKPRLTGEQQLAKLLEGRVAGEPVNCINTVMNRDSRVIDKTAIVYGSGRTVYVQRPRSGAESLDDNDVLVTRLSMPQLCSVDVIQLHDRTTGFWRGFVGLGDFVPYTRPVKTASAN